MSTKPAWMTPTTNGYSEGWSSETTLVTMVCPNPKCKKRIEAPQVRYFDHGQRKEHRWRICVCGWKTTTEEPNQ